MAASEGRPGAKVSQLEQEHSILQSISDDTVGQDTLAARLSDHVDRINSELVSANSQSLRLSVLCTS